VPRSIEEPEKTTDVNVRGTLNVLLAARDHAAVVVFASSSSVYGDQQTFPLHEDMAPQLRSPYAASKLAGEAFCRAWWLSFGVPTVSLRYFNVYGPGQDPANEYAAVVPKFVMACLDGTRPEVHGDGDQSRDFTYIGDVVEANLLAALAPEGARGRVLNIGGGREPTSVNGILEIAADLTGTNPEPVHTPPRQGDVRRTEADISLARRLIGYEPSVDIQEGLRRTVAWFRSNA
jgi:nucleoside-diphosphate-sugar epimerase